MSHPRDTIGSTRRGRGVDPTNIGEVVPYEIRKGNGCPPSKPYGVFKKGESKRLGCHSTKESAQSQIAAIEANESSDE